MKLPKPIYPNTSAIIIQKTHPLAANICHFGGTLEGLIYDSYQKQMNLIAQLNVAGPVYFPERTPENFKNILFYLPPECLSALLKIYTAQQFPHPSKEWKDLFEISLKRCKNEIHDPSQRNVLNMLLEHPWFTKEFFMDIVPSRSFSQKNYNLRDEHLFSLLKAEYTNQRKQLRFSTTIMEPVIQKLKDNTLTTTDLTLKLFWVLAALYHQAPQGTVLKQATEKQLQKIADLPTIMNYPPLLVAKFMAAVALNQPSIILQALEQGSPEDLVTLVSFISDNLANNDIHNMSTHPLLLNSHLQWIQDTLATGPEETLQERTSLKKTLNHQKRVYQALLLRQWTANNRATEDASQKPALESLQQYYPTSTELIRLSNELETPFRPRLSTVPSLQSQFLEPIQLSPALYALFSLFGEEILSKEVNQIILQLLVNGRPTHPHTIKLSKQGEWLQLAYLDNELKLKIPVHIQACSYLKMGDSSNRILFTKGRAEFSASQTRLEGRSLTLQTLFYVLLSLSPTAQIRAVQRPIPGGSITESPETIDLLTPQQQLAINSLTLSALDELMAP